MVMQIWDYGPGNFAFLLDDERDKKTRADIDLLQYLELDLGDDKRGGYAFCYSCPIVELKGVFAKFLEKYNFRGEAILNAYDADPSLPQSSVHFGFVTSVNQIFIQGSCLSSLFYSLMMQLHGNCVVSCNFRHAASSFLYLKWIVRITDCGHSEGYYNSDASDHAEIKDGTVNSL